MAERLVTSTLVDRPIPTTPLLDVEDLVVTATGGTRIVDGISFSIGAGESVGIVGESGSGKSMTARALMGLLPRGIEARGSIRLGGAEIVGRSERHMHRLRGRGIGMLMQDPFTILNPLRTAGSHIAETIRTGADHRSRPSGRELDVDVRRRLTDVGIEDPAAATRYPFELSGGMRQRVALAAALANDPGLLIADEPTTALDVTTQREVLALLRRVQREREMGLLLITHDLRVAFSICDRIMVMRSGQLVEVADPATLRSQPRSSYTAQLLAADLPLHGATDREEARALPGTSSAVPLVEVEGLTKRFGTQRRWRRPRTEHLALDDVSVAIAEGRSVGLVGESGSGKTTLARCLLGLENPTSGSIRVDGVDLSRYSRLSRGELTEARRLVQCVFQDPYSSLNPSHSIGFILGEALRHRHGRTISPEQCDAEVDRLLTEVGLPATFSLRRPAALSGGQRQRVAVARALAMEPRVLVCDESVSALDVSVQRQVLDVLKGVHARGTTLVFITHDLAVARYIADDLVVLYRGRVVETGPAEDVLGRPQHPYTKRLIEAVPSGEPGWLD